MISNNQRAKPVSRLMLLLLLFASCTQTYPNHVAPQPVEAYLADSVLLPEDIPANAHLSMICAVDTDILFYLDREKNRFYYFNFRSGVYIDSVTPLAANIKSFVVADRDSFYYELDDDRLLTCFHKQQSIYDLAPMLRAIDTNLSVQTINAVQQSNDTIVSTARSFIHDPDQIPSRTDVLSVYDILYKIEADTSRYIGKYNPNTEKLAGQDYYTNLDRDRLLMPGGRIVYAYEYCDSLLVYDLNEKAATYIPVATQNFKVNAPFDNRRFGDAEYANRYLSTQSRFHFLHHDKHRKLVYQYLKHKGNFVTNSGEQNSYYDLPFSLLVYDEHLALQKELLLGTKKYWPLKTFITNDGLYIAAHPSIQRVEGKTMFYRFCITADTVAL